MTSIDSTASNGGRTRIWSLVRREERKSLDLGILIGSMLLTLAAFVFNMGWIRFVLLFTTMPLVVMGLYTFVGWMVYWQKWRSWLFYAVSVLHPLSYILLYDSGDSGPSYIFFSLIPVEEDAEDFAQLLAGFAMLSFALSIGLLLLLIVQMWLSRKKAAAENER